MTNPATENPAFILPAPIPILGWIRTPVAPRHGALRKRTAHELAAPLVQHLLTQRGLRSQVDALLLGNALGAGGNPARMTALAAQLSPAFAAFSIDTQCCSGLDAINLGAMMINRGQVDLVIAGGAESWSRAPIRQHRPMHPGEAPIPYDRPAFAPNPEDDPDPAQAVADRAWRVGWRRQQQDEYAASSHRRALSARDMLRAEILPLDGLDHDSYPRALSDRLIQRMPIVAMPNESPDQHASPQKRQDHALSALAMAPEADGAALILMASPAFCARMGHQPAAHWLGGLQQGGTPREPMLCALVAARHLLLRHRLKARQLSTLELHDAFALQGLELIRMLGVDPERLNPHGGGVARGHPIGASGAIALVRVLQTLSWQKQNAAPHTKAAFSGAAGRPPAAPVTQLGMACISAAGGLGTATLVGI